MAMGVGWSTIRVHLTTFPSRNSSKFSLNLISTSRIGTTFCTDIHGSQRMNPTDLYPYTQNGPVEVLLGRMCYWAVTQWRSAGLSSVTGFTRSLWAKPTNNSQASCLLSFSGLFQITDWLFEVGWRTGRVFPCFSARKRLGHQQLCHPPHILNDLWIRSVLT